MLPDGSGAGREAFLAGGANFAGSDAYLSEKESRTPEQCGDAGPWTCPCTSRSPWRSTYSVESLNLDAHHRQVPRARSRSGTPEEIKKQNPDADLPETAITVVHRGDGWGAPEPPTTSARPLQGLDRTSRTRPGPPSTPRRTTRAPPVWSPTTSGTEGAITYADSSAVGDLGTAAIKVGEDTSSARRGRGQGRGGLQAGGGPR
ncbi:hypothetical protein QJS66_09885 [Kocuria rhizophila]|nr:hypothetical protein QJS66_09885 [Kocuria rhizophila]